MVANNKLLTAQKSKIKIIIPFLKYLVQLI